MALYPGNSKASLSRTISAYRVHGALIRSYFVRNRYTTRYYRPPLCNLPFFLYGRTPLATVGLSSNSAKVAIL
jgi:hypothetical protein